MQGGHACCDANGRVDIIEYAEVFFALFAHNRMQYHVF